ncbi:ATP-binding protein [uncultured Polaribacter sp.]|uniref:sensor histidine kinase n=1 Tax=uncultured Polaribacter sp. TaxID=174711 RepID=UPI00260BDF85|nr:ATP-binding protein [uncultured Polaribacter sp.]
MNSLLKRQIRKYLPKEYHSNKDLELFLEAIDKSYRTYDDQFAMLHRATTISSDELFVSNKLLKEETESQKRVIDKLKSVIDTLKIYDADKNRNIIDEKSEELDPLKLADFIDNQAKEIIKINNLKDKLLTDLESQNQELNDYAHMVSHDLKSPLQNIDTLVTWFIDDYKSVIGEAGNEVISQVKNNLEKMDTLIHGILEYSTIGKIEKKLYDLDLNILIKDLIDKIDNPKNTLIKVNGVLPIIKGDQHRLSLLFYNLIHNGLKFNNKEKGIVEINFEEQNDFWKFSVKDNGNGIEKKYFDKIFIAFQKLEDDFKSTGIGLSIVKKIVETFNGEIWLESIPKIETTFFFTIKK